MPLIPKNTPPYYTTENTVKKYIALLTQAGTAAPTATVLLNTTGNTVLWERSGAGDYHTNDIPNSVIPGFDYNPDGAASTTHIPVSDALGTITGYWYIRRNGSLIEFRTMDATFTLVDMNVIFGTGSICTPQIITFP